MQADVTVSRLSYRVTCAASALMKPPVGLSTAGVTLYLQNQAGMAQCPHSSVMLGDAFMMSPRPVGYDWLSPLNNPTVLWPICHD